ncbi:multicopper oxidase domain-containing protein [Effusibacillus consociatus]|uniref:Multicopper oxidase domain-containing protein n=2 Tax=Effusibacillus consociatus TaxID=1117041 RepID=A0ABV9PZZ3_9BACL
MKQNGMSYETMMKEMYDIFTVNGKAGNEIQPLEVKPGERVKLRFVNVGYQSHKLHLPGQLFKVTHTDGQPISPLTKDTLNVKPNTVVNYEGFKPNFKPDPNDKPE